MTRLGGFAQPGFGISNPTVEASVLAGYASINGLSIVDSAVISGAARDSTNTTTTILRAGLVLGKITATGFLTNYDPAATDGSQVAVAILAVELRAQDFDATNATRVAPVYIGGFVQAAQCRGLDVYSRGHLSRQFLFDDDLVGNVTAFPKVVAKTAAYSVVAADRGSIFTNQGASGSVTLTLPAIARGFYAKFYCEADQTFIVAAVTGDTIVAFNDAAADSVSIGTASEKVGTSVTIYSNADGTKWLSEVCLAAETVTPIIAT